MTTRVPELITEGVFAELGVDTRHLLDRAQGGVEDAYRAKSVPHRILFARDGPVPADDQPGVLRR